MAAWRLSVLDKTLSAPRSLQASVSLFPAARSPCGTDDRVKLPNLTDEDVSWRGLEDLYSINESLYECRPDFSPSPDNWANFQKDVDKIFALRHVLNQFNRTRELDDSTLPELGSGAGGGGLEEGSGEELAAEARPTTPAPAPSDTPPALHPPGPTLERKLESVVNDLPERLVGRAAASVLSSGPGENRVDVWAQLEELEGDAFSGNGLMELETRHDSLLRTHNSLQAQLEPDEGLEEDQDMFQAQGYLPLSPQTLRPKVQASTAGSPHSVGVVLQVLPLTLDYEGSGSPPQPSNQTL